VLETGMGGRLDATNALRPEVCVITPIGWDHMQYLGDTLSKIAAEKAGIIKPGIPVVTCPQEPEALEVITRTAEQRGSPLIVVDEPCELPLGLCGEHQRWNAALALAALKAAGIQRETACLAKGLREVQWPARFQKIEPAMILDGAHNLDAARVLLKTWREQFGEAKATLLFGAVAGKDIQAVLREIEPISAEWHLTSFDSPRALQAAEVAHQLHAVMMDSKPVHLHTSLDEALQAVSGSRPLLITGSLYLAGEVLARQADAAMRFERSWQ
jgi:dihydrofolate synthase / folylpolyglutamate synthase